MSDIKRRKTKMIKVRGLSIGGEAPITVQSMTNTDTRNVPQTVEQIRKLYQAGCEIVRVAVPDLEAAEAIKKIRAEMNKFAYEMPLVADIHFDYRLALACMKNGADKIRINPGNIGGPERIRAVVKMAKERGVPIRIGVNSGSLEKKIIARDKGVTVAGMVESALNHVRLLEAEDFEQIVVSIKASQVPAVIETYRLVAEKCDYPLHLGVTHAGDVSEGTIKSAIAMGILLSEGIGDTIRVSLTGDPVQEVKAGIDILKSLGLRKQGIEIISCPTCGRCQIDLIKLTGQVKEALKQMEKSVTVAVMGCAVNGPGEAREADIGIAGGKGEALLFKKGEIIGKIPEEKIVETLLKEIPQM